MQPVSRADPVAVLQCEMVEFLPEQTFSLKIYVVLNLFQIASSPSAQCESLTTFRAVHARGSHGKTNARAAASAALLPSRSHALPLENWGSFSSFSPQCCSLGLLQEHFCWKQSVPFDCADVCQSFSWEKAFCFLSIKVLHFERAQAPRSFLWLAVLLLHSSVLYAHGKCFDTPYHPLQDNLKAPGTLLKCLSLMLRCWD